MFPSPSWSAWRTFIKAIFALPMTDAERQVFSHCTGRQRPPTKPAPRVVAVCGRRSGKSRVAAFLAAYYTAWKDYRHVLAPGETGTAIVTAASRDQAGIIFDAAVKFLEHVPATKAMIARRTADAIELTNHTAISIKTANLRLQRGPTAICFVGDEASFWNSATGTPNQDREVLNAAEPALLTTGGPVILISTPYARTGVVFEEFDQHFGVEDDDTLVWMADSLTMHPLLDAAAIDKAYRRDPEWAASEYGRGGHISFRSDLQSLFDMAVLRACVVTGRPLELRPQPGIEYHAFVDTASGSGSASAKNYGMGIAHKDEHGCCILDVCRETSGSFDPFKVTAEYADLARKYNCTSVTGDRYSPGWVAGAFKQCGLDYIVSELTKSQLLTETLALVNSRLCELPEHDRLLAQFAGLQRRVGPSGRDSVDHRPGQRDDLANAVAGALWLATQGSGLPILPETFRSCNRVLQGLPGYGICYLFGGPFRPSNDAACGPCEGHKFVRDARKRHQQRTGEATDLIAFYKEHVRPNDYAESRMISVGKQELADILGL